MAYSNPAQSRLYADIQRLLSTLLVRDIADPRLQGLAITRVEPSTGSHLVTIWVHGLDHNAEFCMKQLNKMKPHFEHALRRGMARRRVPSLRFKWDEAVDRSEAVLRQLRNIRSS